MKSTLHACASGLVAAALMLPVTSHAVDAGRPAPEFALPGQQGPVKLADYRGKYVYLDFWASWCAPCRQSFPWMNELQSKYGKDGLVVIAVNVDQSRADADRFLAQLPARFAVAFDAAGTTPKSYAVKAMPSSMLIGPDGTVRFVHSGFRENEKAAMETRIRDAMQVPPKTVMLTWPLEFRVPVMQ